MARELQIVSGANVGNRIDRLAGRLHLSDLRELEAVMAFEPHEAVPMMLRQSTLSWAGIDPDDSSVVMLFGVVGNSLLSSQGQPWLVRRRDVKDFKRTYIRHSHEYLLRMLSVHPVLHNYCGSWAKDTIRWLMWMGFNVGPAVPIGRHGEFMHRFEIAARRS